MARNLKITASILNIRLHPHTGKDTYENWISSIYRQKKIAQIHGDRHGMISMIDRRFQSKGLIDGIITTFVKLEDNGNWFNAEKLEKATEAQISEIQIPSNLYPNSAAFFFRFDTDTHRLYFQTYSRGKYFTPSSALKFFRALAADLSITTEFNEASISLIQDKSSMDRLFDLDVIKKVVIKFERPNSDVFDDDFENKIEEHLNETESQEMEISYKAQRGKSIIRDDDMKKLLEAAQTNGSARVTGRDERGAVTLNSQHYPKEFHDKFDPEEMTERTAFIRLIPATPPSDD